ncbi:MAG: hypothetical protein ACHQNT_09875 [Bacteroidia bacterium]
MERYVLSFILLLYGCGFESDEQAKFFPVDPSELIYKKGDCLAFKIDSSNYIAGIVMNFSKDEGGLWYGFCFTDYLDTIIPDISTIKSKNIYGRKIQSTIDDKGYFVGLDFEYMSDSCIKSLNEKSKLIGNLKLDTTKIELGSEGATRDYSEFIEMFKFGRKRRLLPPDDYREILKLDKFRPDEYFSVNTFIIE